MISRVAFAALIALFVTAQARALEHSLELNPRIEGALAPRAAEGQRSLVQRGFLKGTGQVSGDSWRVFSEGFVEADLASERARLRRAENTLALQEFYGELKHEAWSVRAGRQAVRWSESWVLPSLDFWTGRRWNRLFLDPLSEQLTHPTGALFSYSTPAFEASLFGALRPAESYFPEPLEARVKSEDLQLGARIKGRVAGFDWSVAGAELRSHQSIGGSLSYAFDTLVPKLEVGSTSEQERFATLGLDGFPDLSGLLGESWALSFLPQVTLESGDRQLLYVPLRLSSSRHAIELSVYRGLRGSGDRLFSALYRFSALGALDISAYVQDYRGSPETLFGLLESVAGGTVVGMRIEMHERL